MLSNCWQKAMHGLLLGRWPRWCEICQLPLGDDHPVSAPPICVYCLRYFQPTPRCQRCGLPTLLNVAQCGQCLRSPPPWQRVVCIGDYQPPLSIYVQRLKYRSQFWHASWLAKQLAERVTSPPELITCVPLHWRRHWQRGFNQSELLSSALARQLSVSHDGRLFQRIRYTAPQQGMNRAERLRNLRHAFRLQQIPNVQHVAIVDDVMTTGSTVRHLSNLLLEAGVKSIDIYCLCRTPEPKG